MIDIPIGKALAAVEAKSCHGCYFSDGNIGAGDNCPAWDTSVNENYLPCTDDKRQDGKSVIFKLVDRKEEEI